MVCYVDVEECVVVDVVWVVCLVGWIGVEV